VPQEISSNLTHVDMLDERVGHATASTLRLCRHSVTALEAGVRRAHILTPSSGDLLRELYTCDGAGTLISRDMYDSVRPAEDGDVMGILDLIQPLIDKGILVSRSHLQLQAELDNAYVQVRDDVPVACGMLIPYGLDHAEISCLAVNPRYRGKGRGDIMLTYLERVAVTSGIHNVFVLSTQTMQWFQERGFNEVDLESLPESRQAIYNHRRGSKVYMKHLRSLRDVDAEEHFLGQKL